MSDLIERLGHAITTASNDDYTKPMSEKRKRHVERLTTMYAAIDEIKRLRTVIRETAAYARALGRDYSESFAGGSSIENALAQVAERLEKEADNG